MITNQLKATIQSLASYDTSFEMITFAGVNYYNF